MKKQMKKLIRALIIVVLAVIMTYAILGGLVLIHKLADIIPAWVALISIPAMFIYLSQKSE